MDPRFHQVLRSNKQQQQAPPAAATAPSPRNNNNNNRQEMIQLTTALCVVAATVGIAASRDVQIPPGSFDYFLLAQSWQPGFCETRPGPGCYQPHEFWKTHFTLHGLWPQLASIDRPRNCTAGPQFPDVFDGPKLVNAIGMEDLVTYWPNVKEDEHDPNGDYPEFWQHEWEGHGTCSGMSLVDYFRTTINMLKNAAGGLTPDLIQQNVGRKVSVEQLQNAYGGGQQVSIRCGRGNILTEVRTCWTKDNNNHPVQRRACPADVLAGGCRGVVRIPSF